MQYTGKYKKKLPESEFICKICDMFERYPDIVGWSKDGTEFVIRDVQKMQKIVLPEYFRHINFSSFVRQLNMYDFHKVSRKENMLTFRNEIFHRGNDRNFHFIHRKRKAAKEDAIYEQEFQYKYKEILGKLEEDPEITQYFLTALNKLMEHKFFITKYFDNIKNHLNELSQYLVNLKTKKVAAILKYIQNKYDSINRVMDSCNKIDTAMSSYFLRQRTHQEPQSLRYSMRTRSAAHLASINNLTYFQDYRNSINYEYTNHQLYFNRNSLMLMPSLISMPNRTRSIFRFDPPELKLVESSHSINFIDEHYFGKKY